jgi:hypothetical protein
VATKQELAESMTVDQLRDFAGREGIDVSGLSTKAELVERVSNAASKEALEAEADALAGTEPTPGSTPSVAGEGPAAAERISPADTAALAEAGQSPADLELRLTRPATGESRIVKSSPETPTLAQVEASETEIAGPPDVSVVVTDSDGNEQDARVRPDDAALLAQRTASQQADHPANTSKGHWSNPVLGEMTEEEKEADAKAYADRVS